MKRVWTAFAVLGLAVALVAAAPLAAQEQERWLHVRVEERDSKGAPSETVRVNLPLSVVEKVLPAVKVNRLEQGRLKLSELRIHEVDVRGVLEAVRGAKDGEFVTVESQKENVRVAKQGGYLIVQVRETREGEKHERVDVKMPFSVVDALLSGGKDELDILAGIRALKAHGDAELVTVKERRSSVRVWIDTKNGSE
jgi:hypothetical protein